MANFISIYLKKSVKPIQISSWTSINTSFYKIVQKLVGKISENFGYW